MSKYHRQILFSPIGEAGQEQLQKSHLLIVGLGALGAASAEMFARAGIGKLTLLDRDYVEMSNLQRQPLYDESDAKARLPKAIAAKRRLQQVNPEINIVAEVVDVTASELDKYIAGVDMMIDGTDNFDVRMIMNDIAQKYTLPWIYGSCVGSYGITYTIIPEKTPCLACVMDEIPVGTPTCDTVGIIQPAATQVVLYQVTEAMKWLVGDEKAMDTKLRAFDLWQNEQSAIDIHALKKATCPSCSKDATYPYLQKENETKLAVLCGRDTVQIRPSQTKTIDLQAITTEWKAANIRFEANEFLLSLPVEGQRIVLFKDGRALVHGTKDIAQAKSLYDRYFG